MFRNKISQPSTEGMELAERCRVEAGGLYRSGKQHCAEAVVEVVSGAEKIREGTRAGK